MLCINPHHLLVRFEDMWPLDRSERADHNTAVAAVPLEKMILQVKFYVE